MPLSSGLSIHDDTKHKGSAKRDTLNGVAALNSAGSILALGESIYLVRDGFDYVKIRERTSDEAVFFFKRIGANNYSGEIKSSGANSLIQLANMKDIANGIAGLNSNTELIGVDIMTQKYLSIAMVI